MAAIIRSRAYLIVAFALAAWCAIGFARTFYLRHWFNVPPITTLLVLHGAFFTAWFALFVIQARLIYRQNYQTHKQIGIAGAVLAGLIVISGLATAVVSASATRPRAMGLTSPQFVVFPTLAILMFGGFVAAALYWRRTPNLHRRLMMLAMISVLGPPTGRVVSLVGVQGNFLLVQSTVTALFVAACLVADWVKHRTVHPLYSIGGTLIVLSWPLRAMLARTPAWEAVGNWMASLN
jgi:hypothetical protein